MVLKKGDTIGFISPSSPITASCPNRFSRAVKFLEDKGFILKPGLLTGKKDYYRSGSISDRVQEINEMIRDENVKCIMSTIGGTNSNSLLPYIDYESFQKKPKIIIGYSDMTAILWAIYQKTGLSTYYGPALVASFGELEPYNEITYSYFEGIFMNKGAQYDFIKPDQWTDEYLPWEEQNKSKEPFNNEWISLHGGSVTGRLLVGNLNTITGIWGSQYCPEIKNGDILFIEDALKSASIVERLFSFLKINNVFEKIGGLILGKLELFDDEGTGLKPYEILLEVLGDYHFPFLADVDCCHTHPMFTMPIGATIHLDATKKKIKLISSL